MEYSTNDVRPVMRKLRELGDEEQKYIGPVTAGIFTSTEWLLSSIMSR